MSTEKWVGAFQMQRGEARKKEQHKKARGPEARAKLQFTVA